MRISFSMLQRDKLELLCALRTRVKTAAATAAAVECITTAYQSAIDIAKFSSNYIHHLNTLYKHNRTRNMIV